MEGPRVSRASSRSNSSNAPYTQVANDESQPRSKTPDDLAVEGRVDLSLPDQTVWRLASNDIADLTERFLQASDGIGTIIRWEWLVEDRLARDAGKDGEYGVIMKAVSSSTVVAVLFTVGILALSVWSTIAAYQSKKEANKEKSPETGKSKEARKMLGARIQRDIEEDNEVQPGAPPSPNLIELNLQKINAALSLYKNEYKNADGTLRYKNIVMYLDFNDPQEPSSAEEKPIPKVKIRYDFNVPEDRKVKNIEEESQPGAPAKPKIQVDKFQKPSALSRFKSGCATLWKSLTLAAFAYWVLWIGAAILLAFAGDSTGIFGLHDALSFSIPALFSMSFIVTKMRNYKNNKDKGNAETSLYAELSGTAQKDTLKMMEKVWAKLDYDNARILLLSQGAQPQPEPAIASNHALAPAKPSGLKSTLEGFDLLVRTFSTIQYVLWYLGDAFHKVTTVIFNNPILVTETAIAVPIFYVVAAISIVYAVYTAWTQHQIQKKNPQPDVANPATVESLSREYAQKCAEFKAFIADNPCLQQSANKTSPSVIIARGKKMTEDYDSQEKLSGLKSFFASINLGFNLLMTTMFFARTIVIPGTVAYFSAGITLGALFALTNVGMLLLVAGIATTYLFLKCYSAYKTNQQEKAEKLVENIKLMNQNIEIAALTVSAATHALSNSVANVATVRQEHAESKGLAPVNRQGVTSESQQAQTASQALPPTYDEVTRMRASAAASTTQPPDFLTGDVNQNLQPVASQNGSPSPTAMPGATSPSNSTSAMIISLFASEGVTETDKSRSASPLSQDSTASSDTGNSNVKPAHNKSILFPPAENGEPYVDNITHKNTRTLVTANA